VWLLGVECLTVVTVQCAILALLRNFVHCVDQE
jgi:hypothetical protein